MGEDKGKQIVPFREGLFVKESNGVFLIGNRCEICGQIFFPSRPFCFDCLSDRMELSKLGKKGKLYSYTTSYMPSLHFAPPYTVGWIDLAKGIRIFAPIEVSEGQNLEMGMDVELVIDELWQEEDKIVVGYKARPVYQSYKEG